jgi:hypothetical protein
LKTHDVDVVRIKSIRHDKGLIELGVDLSVQTQAQRGQDDQQSRLQMSVEQARTLLVLLKQQFAELDRLQPRSRRSGRC